MEIRFAAEPIATLAGFQITNSLLASLVASLTLVMLALFVSRKVNLIPNMFQNIIELVIDTLNQINLDLSGKKTRYIFPWFASFFLFILVSNWIGLLPGFGSIGFWEHHEGKEMFIPLLRPANTDLNMTLGLALISLVATHVLSIRFLGLKEYIGRFISFNPVNLFVGFLEIVSEFTKIASLSLRLFGNVFAGETLLMTTSSFLAFILPLPFLILETVVGLVQALIFAMLTLVFMTILTTSHHVAKERG